VTNLVPESNRPKDRRLFGRRTNLPTNIAVVLLALFVLTSAVQVVKDVLYISDNIQQPNDWFLGNAASSFSWLLALVVVILTSLGRKNLGFLFAVASVAFYLPHTIRLFPILFRYFEYGLDLFIEFFDLPLTAWTVANFVLYPIAMFLLILGRPGIQKLFKKSVKS
jgi:hypothetical protein